MKSFLSRIPTLVRNAALVALTLVLATGCNDVTPDIDGPDGQGGCLTLRLASTVNSSRAETDPDDTDNENLINDAWIFLFPVTADDNSVPVLKQNVTVDQRSEADVTVRFNRDIIPYLFVNGGNTAIAYVIANLPATVAIPENPTWGQLKALQIAANFATTTAPASFVMDGDAEVTKSTSSSESQTIVKGTVPLKREASKIRLNVNVAEEIEDVYGDIWTPVLANMNVLITNGVNRTCIQPTLYTPAAVDRFHTELGNPAAPARGFTKINDTEAAYPYSLTTPFYTYPNDWAADNEDMTYLTLILQFSSGGSYRTCYYMVPVIAGETHLTRNVSYRVNINVNILGNTKPDKPLELTDVSYQAVDWGSEKFNINIDDYRYLVVDQNTFSMNNDGSISIPFYSSHETVIRYELDTLNYYLFNTTAAGIEREMAITNTIRNRSTTTLFPDSTGTATKIYSDWIDNEIDPTTNTRTLHFNHRLYQWQGYASTNGTGTALTNQQFNSEADATARLGTIQSYALQNTLPEAYSRYRMTITIVQKDKIGQPDEALYSEKFVIWQYPAMYIESEANKFIWVSNEPYGAPVYGNVYINRTQTGNSGNMVPSGLTGENRNPNMYVISITQLSSDRYIVGEARSMTIDNLNYNNTWVNAPAIGETGQRKLTYYYPADVSDSKKFYVAPKLRIASSYGVSPNMNKTNAQRRCASYQELNYPAGRWRLPTYGELEYIINLSNNGKIPVLFSPSSSYWTAQGSVSGQVNASGQLGDTNTNNAHVRCVYDEWYWGDSKVAQNGTVSWRYPDNIFGTTYTTEKYPFTWGDAQRK